MSRETSGRRRGRPFHRAGEALGRRLSEAAAKRGFAEPDVLIRWAEIVGADLARDCQPVRITYGRAAPGLGATLLVQANGARATEIEHRVPQIVERVNAFYGYRAVSRIRLTQATGRAGQPGGFAEDAPGFSGKPPVPPPPDAAATARAAELARDIRDPVLRAALIRLGACVLGRTADPSTDRRPE